MGSSMSMEPTLLDDEEPVRAISTFSGDSSPHKPVSAFPSTWIPISDFWFAILVFGSYVVLINFKNIWLRPHVLGRSVHMHEGLVFIAIVAAVVFTGILGAFIIVPVLASAGVIVGYMRRRILGLPPFPPVENRSIRVGLVSEEKEVQEQIAR